jgi:glutathione peroxidase
MTLSTLLLFSFLFRTPSSGEALPGSIYEFRVAGLTGDTIDFAQFKGKKILIVNTASKCGFTPQYDGLEKLYKRFEGKLVIVGFPSNDFLRQEPGSADEISGFCKKNYGVTFPMAAKIDVRGRRKAPIYRWLTGKQYNGFKDSRVKWNFQKYLLDETGKLIAVFPPSVRPESDEIVSAVSR